MRGVLQQGLNAYRQLPAEKRRPGAVRVAELGRVDQRYDRKPPAGAVVLNVYTRILDRDGKGKLCHGSCQFPGGDKTAHDHVWLTAAEVQSLVPAGTARATPCRCPARLPNDCSASTCWTTRGEPPFWTPNKFTRASCGCAVEEASEKGVRLKLVGHALLATNSIVARADRGFDVHLLGTIELTRGGRASCGSTWWPWATTGARGPIPVGPGRPHAPGSRPRTGGPGCARPPGAAAGRTRIAGIPRDRQIGFRRSRIA